MKPRPILYLWQSLAADTLRAIFNRHLAGDLSDCDYFCGTGTCSAGASCGYFGEPSCMTDRPLDGWPSERNLVGRLRWVWKGE